MRHLIHWLDQSKYRSLLRIIGLVLFFCGLDGVWSMCIRHYWYPQVPFWDMMGAYVTKLSTELISMALIYQLIATFENTVTKPLFRRWRRNILVKDKGVSPEDADIGHVNIK